MKRLKTMNEETGSDEVNDLIKEEEEKAMKEEMETTK